MDESKKEHNTSGHHTKRTPNHNLRGYHHHNTRSHLQYIKPNKYLFSDDHSFQSNDTDDSIDMKYNDGHGQQIQKYSKQTKKRSLASAFKSVSTSQSSTAISAQSVTSISNSALSLLDYDIERTNMESACMSLMDLTFDIGAIWVVARPINRTSMVARSFDHWVLKLHAGPALISIDFFESSGRGAFGISTVCASWSELEDFLTYYITDPDTGKQFKKPWKILSSAVPAKYDQMKNIEKHLLPLEMARDSTVQNNEEEHKDKKIQCDYTVRDISEFIEDWVDDHQSYNSLGTNCQRFAYDLYRFLIGDYYPNKVELLRRYFQSPVDRTKEKLNSYSLTLGLEHHEEEQIKSTEDTAAVNACENNDDEELSEIEDID